ncbi:Glycogen synthase [Thalassoglobus neptunius]|uniref:Glycogen synthase n=1 Tax=Thalassoglobus neptunius TaxID=1938619 RepID=A0A5C5VYF7_9PLAN|nr:glycosyltransferase family 4 protein [Thalassoglobus neptunius]TWT43065.1 Glycogen synthase [Thalassoglobus neptunius]
MSVFSHVPLASQYARDGRLSDAERLLQNKEGGEESGSTLIANNLSVIYAMCGDVQGASLELNQVWEDHVRESPDFVAGFPAVLEKNIAFLREQAVRCRYKGTESPSRTRTKIAIVSLLFNWPSTGGGAVHTKELAEFLTREGYDVRHFYAVYEGWRVGEVREVLPYRSVPLRFPEEVWNAEQIRETFRNAVGDFAPDAVIVTDSWNTKPLLAEAVADYPYYLRIAALESICPLNNVRLLVNHDGVPCQCPNNQLVNPKECLQCVKAFRHQSGSLHQAERELAGFFQPEYPDRLRQAFMGATGVLVVNPAIAQLVQPHNQSTYIVPSGFNSARFPSDLTVSPPERSLKTILFAGLSSEYIKGFSVLVAAVKILRERRQDFELLVTDQPPRGWQSAQSPWIQFVGWQSQQDLPQLISKSDILVFPTVAQEALGRTAVEAMGCGRPVVASRIGGLAWVIEDQVNGLLCHPGDSLDLAQKLETLLDDGNLRVQLGQNGREKFLRDFTWDSILKRHYFQLFGPAVRSAADMDHSSKVC